MKIPAEDSGSQEHASSLLPGTDEASENRVTTHPSPETAPTETLPPGRKRLFTACLVVSLMLHLAAALLAMVAGTVSSPTRVAQYIELADAPTPPPPPEIHAPSPAAPPVVPEAVPPPSAEEPPPEQLAEPAPEQSPASPQILSTPLGLGMTYGFFKSIGEGRTLREDIRDYYFQILERINGTWWQKAGTTEGIRQDGIVDISIAPDGTLVEARVTVTTGSAAADRTIVEAIRESAPFAPPPIGFGQFLFRAPLRIAAPSNLFRLGSGR